MTERFLFVLNSKSEDVFILPRSVVAIETSGKKQCHVILDGGYVIRDVKTSPEAMKSLIDKFLNDAMSSLLSGGVIGCGCPAGDAGEEGPKGPDVPPDAVDIPFVVEPPHEFVRGPVQEPSAKEES